MRFPHSQCFPLSLRVCDRYIPNGSGRDYFIAMDSSMTRGKHDFSYYEINPPTEARCVEQKQGMRKYISSKFRVSHSLLLPPFLF